MNMLKRMKTDKENAAVQQKRKKMLRDFERQELLDFLEGGD